VEIVHANRLAAEPFQIHFCNYNKDGPFHKAYSTQISYDENLIFETEKSYLDSKIFKDIAYPSYIVHRLIIVKNNLSF
jgi:hypothetical protein